MRNKADVKQITVISGKGGTGKSSILASLAYKMQDVSILVDADVDAPDLYLIFPPKNTKKQSFFGLKKASIDLQKCSMCNLCVENCRFNAIDSEININEFKCEGCSVCFHICPEEAITMIEEESGYYMKSKTRIGTMIHARLNPGEESSGLLVAEVRKLAREEAEREKKKLILIDGSPGIGCPVISSLTGTNLAIAVTEPSLSGFYDLKRILELLNHFRIKGYVIINKYDINLDISNQIEEYCKNDFPVIARIPFNPIFTQAMIQQKTVLEMHNESKEANKIKIQLSEIAQFIAKELSLDK